MATSVAATNEVHPKIEPEHLEVFSLIWLDDNKNVGEERGTQQKLRAIINHVKKFERVQECQTYIEHRSKKDPLVLVVSGRLGQQIVPSIHTLRQVSSIYVYCMDRPRNEQWASKFAKVRAVIVTLDELASRLQADFSIQKKVEEPLSINTFTTGSTAGKSTTEVNGRFVFSQVLVDCLLRMKSNQTNNDELITCCAHEYQGNEHELVNLREFEKHYSPSKAIWWYTGESFFYKTLNAALRIENIHVMFLYRSYIADICRQLKDHQAQQRLKVYRGQFMSIDELDALQKLAGQFISINSFFSTSLHKRKALTFLNTSLSEHLERVLFKIDADPKVAAGKPFANISAYSRFADEAEVLFMLGSIFRLTSVERGDDRIWTIRMSLCGDDEHDLKQVLLHMKHQYGSGKTNLRIFGMILWDMGKFDLAAEYYSRFLKELSPDDIILAAVYEDLAKINSMKGDLDMSMQWRQKALAVKFQTTPIASIKPTANTVRSLATLPMAQLKDYGYALCDIQLMQPTETCPIGLKLTKQPDPLQFVFTAIAKGTKADLAGLKVNDWLIQMEGQDVRLWEFSDVSLKLQELLMNVGLVNMVIARKTPSALSEQPSGIIGQNNIRHIVLKEAAGLDFNSFIPDGDESQAQIHFFSNIDPLSIAAEAGLRVGDRLIAVNGSDVSQAVHEDIRRMLQKTKPVQLTVTNDPRLQELIESIKLQQTTIEVEQRQVQKMSSAGSSSDSRSVSHKYSAPPALSLPVRTRVCVIHPSKQRAVGFALSGKTSPPYLICQIEKSSPAEKAGLSIDDAVLSINGKSVAESSYEDTVKLLKEAIQQISFELIVRNQSPPKVKKDEN